MEKQAQHFSLKLDKDIVIFKGYGVWKHALSLACIESINEVVSSQNKQPFALIVDTSEVKSLTPQCFNEWEVAIDSWSKVGLKVTARIDKPEASFYKIFLSGFDNILRMNTKFYTSSTESYALKSLHQSGFLGFEDNSE